MPERKGSKKLSFAIHLWDGFDIVRQRTADGLAVTKDVVEFIKEIQEAEAAFSARVAKACKAARGETFASKIWGRGNASKELGALRDAWLCIIGETEKLADAHDSYARALQADVHAPLAEWYRDREAIRKKAMLHGQHVLRQFNMSMDVIRKARAVCVKLSKDVALAERENDDAMARGKTKDASKAAARANAAKAKLKDADKAYKESIQNGNQAQTNYYQKVMPLVLNDMEQLEADRIDTLTRTFKEMLTKRKPIPDTENHATVAMAGKLPLISAVNILQDFIYNNRTGADKALPFEVDADFSPQVVFGESLTDVMALQHETHPTAKVPVILDVLIKAIDRLGGRKSEGIFRLSASATEVREQKRAIDRGNYDLQGVRDPNVPAALLKYWLRELPEPIIPSKLYKSALETIEHPEKSVELIRKIPDLNRKILTVLLNFLVTIDFKATKMSPENLGMVFGPALLRNPSDDPEKILMGAALEQAFVTNLIAHFALKTNNYHSDETPAPKDSSGRKRSHGRAGSSDRGARNPAFVPPRAKTPATGASASNSSRRDRSKGGGTAGSRRR